LQNNGGTTQTHALLAGSIAINAGSNALVPAGLTYDQRGGGYPRIFGASVDMGAFETLNTAPIANNDSYNATEDTALNIAASGVLGNDTDGENNPLTATIVTNAANGSVTLNADGSFSYTPNADFNGSDSFTYKANDGTADSNTVTVSINVSEVNDAPDAEEHSATTEEDTS
jgi:VCBS repeat-containing protein